VETTAEVVRTGGNGTVGDMVVVAAVVGMMAAEEAPEPDMADTRLLELRERRA
jgi:hypothetical protein